MISNVPGLGSGYGKCIVHAEKERTLSRCLGDVSQDVPGVLQDKPRGCLLAGRSGWYLLGSFCPHISQHLFQTCGYPKEEPVPAAVWEGEEGEEKEPCVLVSVTV